MNDPTFTASDYLRTDVILESMSKNLEIQFQVDGEKFDRDTMQKHVNKRMALLLVRTMVVDEMERVTEESKP